MSFCWQAKGKQDINFKINKYYANFNLKMKVQLIKKEKKLKKG